ncbi:MAG: hypothetical protein U0L88_04900 [Acutalibacteraceae bacterium]|nr:hypothetical protein [Acutalibacteraceae bacterium]
MYYYPPYYNNGAMPDMLTQMRQNTVQQQPSNGIVWVQGESAAKSYPVAPNTTVMLLDSESSTFYLKTSDASGMPLPLRVFDYKERTQNGSNLPTNAPQGGLAVDLSNYVTYDQLNEILDNMAQTQKKEKKSKGETENA